MRKKGKIKYTDPEKGYGYILAEDADGPTDTVLFEAKDTTTEIDELVEGTDVVFEVDENAAQATGVDTA